jgi:hypothetical protein
MMDRGSQNPRMQCLECGRWMRLFATRKGERVQLFAGACSVTEGDHPIGMPVCIDCCPTKCRERLCDCENPEPISGVALVSEDCPVHASSPLSRPESK